jgi:hypothetical protein
MNEFRGIIEITASLHEYKKVKNKNGQEIIAITYENLI